MRKVWNLSFKRLETLNIAKRRSILGVSAAQDSPLKNVDFSKFVSQQPQTVLKVSSFKVINQRFFLVLTRTYFEEKICVVVSDIPTNLTSNCPVIFNPLSANPKNGQTLSNNSSTICWRIVWMCLTILWNWQLEG